MTLTFGDESDALDVHGDFWIAGHEEAPLKGWLTFDPASGGDLTVLGRFGDADLHSDLMRDVRVLGLCNGQRFTLDNCFEARRSNNAWTNQESSMFRVDRVIQGSHFEKDTDLKADRISFGITDLTGWLRQSSLAVSDNTHERQSIHAAIHPDIEFVAGSARGTIRHQIQRTDHNFRSKGIAERHRVTITGAQSEQIDDLIDLASDFQDLVSLGLNSHAPFVKMVFTDDAHRDHRRESDRAAMRLHARWTKRQQNSGALAQPWEMFYTYEDLDGPDGISRWMTTAAEHRSILGRLTASKFSDLMFTEDRFANYVAAAEGFHRKKHGTPRNAKQRTNLKTRLLDLYDYSDPVGLNLSSERDKWAKRVKDLRDDIAHSFYERPLDTASGDLYWLGESVHILILACLLKETGAPAGVFQHIIQNPETMFVAERVKEALAS